MSRSGPASIGLSDLDYEESPLQALRPLRDGSVIDRERSDSNLEGFFTRMMDLFHHAEEIKEVMVDRMHDFMRARIMGRVLDASTTGGMLNVMLGVAL